MSYLSHVGKTVEFHFAGGYCVECVANVECPHDPLVLCVVLVVAVC